MPQFLPAADRPDSAGRTIMFEGAAHGAALSFFAVDIDPGKAVALHFHPYSEIWIVQSGTVRFRTRDRDYEGGPNDIMIVEPNTPHGFVATGTEPLRMMCLHDSGEIVQTFIEPEDA